jgi:hypothetical protein
MDKSIIMIINTFQEIVELDKLKPKILKAQIEQRKREKGKRFIKVPNSIGNLHKLEK